MSKWYLRKVLIYKEKLVMKRDRGKDFLGRENNKFSCFGIGKNLFC